MEKDKQIEQMSKDYARLERQLKQVQREFRLYKREVERDKADSTDYRGLSQKFAKLYQMECRKKNKKAAHLQKVANSEEMANLVRQEEYDMVIERLKEMNKMFEYLKHEMSNAENYRTQIQELKLVVDDANRHLKTMADIKIENRYLREAVDIKQCDEDAAARGEGRGFPDGFIKRWLKSSEKFEKIRMENRRCLDEIESLRRQREIYKLNYTVGRF